jgi:uncharacterized protein
MRPLSSTETLGGFESVKTARVLNDLNEATRLHHLNDLKKSRLVQPDDRQQKAGDFHDWPQTPLRAPTPLMIENNQLFMPGLPSLPKALYRARTPTGLRRPLMLTVAIILLTCSCVHALNVPPLRGRVNDLAGMLTLGEAQQLEEQLRTFEEQTTHQIVVLTLSSLQGDALEDFSIRVVDAWKIGQKGNDNGVLFLIARDDRKIRIEVGYGLEGILPDAIANRIIQDVIVPRFREQNFAGGIHSGIAALIQTVQGEQISANLQEHDVSANRVFSIVVLLFAGTVLFGVVVGFGQPTPVRAGAIGALVAAVVGIPVISIVGGLFWVIGMCIGAMASMSAVKFAHRAWGRSWNVRAAREYDFSPRDTFTRGYGAGSGGSGGRSTGGGSGGFRGGGGGFGGGGASGGW